MAVWRFVSFDRKEAQFLADLTGIDNDLSATVEICDLLTEHLKKLPLNWRILDALTCAVLIRYARAFASGVRQRIPNSMVEDLPEDIRKDHDWFIALRDKYVAHSVNSFEENEVVVYLVPEERGPKGVASVSVQQRRLVSLGTDDIRRLRNLAEAIQSKVSYFLEAERTKVLEFTRSLPSDDFYGQIDTSAKVPICDDVKKPRKKK